MAGPLGRRGYTEIPLSALRMMTDMMPRSLGEEFEGLVGEGLAPLPVDVLEHDGEFVIHASVPGVKREHLDVEVENEQVTITARYDSESDDHDGHYHRRERHSQTMQRRVGLPAPVSEEGVTASLTDGVLTLKLPKRDSRQRRKINIS